MSKKIISLALTMLMILTFVTPSFAAELSDVDGTKYSEAVGKLSSLGIMTGYNDGTFKPDNNITRAEFAAMAVRALGLESTAKGSNGSTQFKDVAAGQWFTGYINIASAKGIVKGHGDGSFKPTSNVTYGEAVTMVVRVLGYEPAIEGTSWPSNYLVKAAEIGLTGNLQFDVNAAANRGDIALLLNNALDIDLMEQVGYGDDRTWEEKEGKTLLTEYLNVHELEEAVVAQTPGYSQGKLDADEVEIVDENDNTYFFKVSEGLNLDTLLGHEVTLYVKDADNDGKVEDDEVITFVTSTTNERDIIAWDYIVGISEDKDGGGYTLNDGGMTVSLDGADDTFDFADNAVVYYNYEKVSNLATMASSNIGEGFAALYEVAGQVILNDDDEVVFMNMFNYDDPVVITDVDVDDEKVSFFKKSDNETTLKLDGEDYIVYKNGEFASLEDLAVDDVMYLWTQSDGTYALDAYAGQISGTLEAIYADSNKYWDYALEVDGKRIYVGPNFTLSLDNNDTVDLLGEVGVAVDPAQLADLEDMVGTEVTVYLGKYQTATDGWNYGRHIVSSIEDVDSTYFMVSEEPWSARTSGTKYYVELVNKNDQEVVYEFTEDDTEFNGTVKDLAGQTDLPTFTGLVAGDLVEVEFNSDGTIASIDELTGLSGSGSAANINDDYDRIKLNGTWYYVTNDTAIFTIIGTSYEATDWDSLEDITGTFNVDAAQVDDKELEAIVISNVSGSIGSKDYGLVLKRAVTADGLFVTMAVDNQVVEMDASELNTTDQGNLLEGVLVEFTATGNELDDITVQSKNNVIYTNPSDIVANEFNKASVTVTGETYGVVKHDVVDGSGNVTDVELYLDVDASGAMNTGDTLVGTWNVSAETFAPETNISTGAPYEAQFAFAKYEIASAGVNTSNGVIEVVVNGLDEDVDPTHFIDVDQFGDDSFFYDVDSSHLADPATKILSLSDLTDGDILNVYDINSDGIYDYIVVVDR